MIDNDGVGDPEEFDQDTYRDMNFPNRPQGGFIEERIMKMESLIGRGINNYSDIETRISIVESGLVDSICIACDQNKPSNAFHQPFPICQDCLNNLGKITKTKNNWIFKG